MSTEQSIKEALSGLRQALDEERSALLDGRYDALAAALGVKESLTQSLELAIADPAAAKFVAANRKQISALIAAAKENEILLARAKGGATAAHQRIRSLIDRQQSLGTYSADGTKTLAAGAGVTRQKLA